MKAKITKPGAANPNSGKSFGAACLKSCQAILAQISQARGALFAEARDTLKVQEQVLRLALNEAEALAWQTLYPQLVFPALATEKVQKAAAWSNRQRTLASRPGR